jgi:hypothetical protein
MTRATAISLIGCIVALSFAASGEVSRFSRTVPVPDQPVVSDNVTRLVWQGCAAGLTGTDCSGGSTSRLNWHGALAYCEGLEWGGTTDWRLPNIRELTSIVDNGRMHPSIDPAAFPGTPEDWYWSSTSLSHDPSGASSIHLGHGLVGGAGKPATIYVRCVRDAP